MNTFFFFVKKGVAGVLVVNYKIYMVIHLSHKRRLLFHNDRFFTKFGQVRFIFSTKIFFV